MRWSPARTALTVCLLAALVLLVFGQTLSFEFVHFDDDVYIFKNPPVARGLSAEGVRWAFTTTHAGFWQPLTWLSLMLDASLFGLAPRGFHGVNVLWHAVNATLLFLVLRALTGAAGRSAAVAALFAVHPLHVESVAWATERKDLLFTAFGFAAIGAYAWYVRRPGPGRMAVVAAAYAASLLAKQMLVTLPLLLLLLDHWPLGRFAARRPAGGAARRALGPLVLEKAPLFALAAAASVAAYAAQRSWGAVSGADAIGPAARFANVVVAYAGYLVKSVWPAGLSPLYVAPPAGHALAAVVASAALVAAACVAVARVGHPAFRVGGLWFLAALVPVSGIVPIGLQFMADRFTYVPLVGFAVAAVWSLGDRLAARGVGRAAAGALAAATIAALAALAVPQAGIWKDSETLFARALRVDPGNWAARYFLGTALLDERRYEEAAAAYAEGLALNPAFRRARNNLGAALAGLGRHEEAIAHYRQAILAAPGDPLPHDNLAASLAALGRLEEAAREFGRVVALEPANARAHNNLGSVLARLGRLGEARARFAEALRIAPGYGAARANLERLGREAGGAGPDALP